MRIKDILGMEVFDSECRMLGTVSDIEFTSNSKLALIIEAEKGERKVAFEKIDAIGDKIILKEKT